MKQNGHLIFQCTIDCWGACLDAGMPVAIISSNVVDSVASHTKIEGKIKNFKLD